MIRNIVLTILSITLCCLTSFAQYQVNCIDTNGDTMTFRVVGYGKNAKIAAQNAEVKVIKALMFEGVPNTQQQIPMVPETESSAMDKFGKELNKFFESGYQSEITRSIIVRKFGKDINKEKSITLEVTVNIRALRNKLERIGVIRKFGL